MMFRRWDARPRELGRLLKSRIRGRWVDPLLFLAGCAVVYELAAVGREWTGVHRTTVEISLSPWMLPQYTASAEARGPIWRSQLLTLRLFKVVDQLIEMRQGLLTKDEVLQEIAQRLPREAPEAIFETLVAWARFGGLFVYSEEDATLSKN